MDEIWVDLNSKAHRLMAGEPLCSDVLRRVRRSAGLR